MNRLIDNKFIKIGLIVGTVFLLLLLAVYLMKSDKKTPGQENSIKSVEEAIEGKIFDSKTDAYDAVANEKETFYNRPLGVFQHSSQQPSHQVVEPLNTETEVSDQKHAQEEQFNAAYQEVAENVKQMYETPSDGDMSETNVAPSVQSGASVPEQQPIAAETPEERRRKAMLQGWGMAETTTATSAVEQHSMFQAVIHGTQLVKSGQTALFRTKEPIQYGNLLVPANTLLSGITSVAANRLTIKINSVRLGREVFALPLDVFGSDGIAGIPLNYDEMGKIANSETSSTALRETSSAMSSYGGTIGRVVGAVTSSIGNQVRSTKSLEVKLIDNQVVILKIAKE